MVTEVCVKMGANPDFLLKGQGEKFFDTNAAIGRQQGARSIATQRDSPGKMSEPANMEEPRAPDAPVGLDKMDQEQHIAAIVQLFKDISSAERTEILRNAAEEAIRRGSIMRRPDWMMTPEWAATQTIAEASNKSKRKPGRYDN